MDNKLGIINLNGLSIGYGNEELLSGISASLGVGKFVLLLGANGKGKSTLLKTVAGQLKPIKGKVLIANENVSEQNIAALARVISFQSSVNFIPNEVTVLDMLQYARIPYLGRLPKLSHEDHEIIDNVAEELSLKDLLSKSYMELSDGQKQLVNIARSLVQDTSIILLDEPTAHLDILNKKMIYELLRIQAHKGKSIIVSAHDLYEAYDYADEFWIINNQNQFSCVLPSEMKGIEDLKSRLFD